MNKGKKIRERKGRCIIEEDSATKKIAGFIFPPAAAMRSAKYIVWAEG